MNRSILPTFFFSFFLLSFFACQNEVASTDTAPPKKEEPSFLNIQLPEFVIDSLLEKKTLFVKDNISYIDIYLKPVKDSLLLSINKEPLIKMEAIDSVLYHLQVNKELLQRIRTRSNLYIDKSTPFYLVDYLQKKLQANNLHTLGYVNDSEQNFQVRLPPALVRLWDKKEPGTVQSAPLLPPPTFVLPGMVEKNVFSKTYLETLTKYGIEQKKNPERYVNESIIKPYNLMEVKLTSNNEIQYRRKIIQLEEIIKEWNQFMGTESGEWPKKITSFRVSGSATYEAYHRLYASLRTAFEIKTNNLALSIFGKNYSVLGTAERKTVRNKLPLIFVVELAD